LSEAQRAQFGSSTLLQLPANTRWFSKWSLIASIVNNEDCLKSAIWHQTLTSNKEKKFREKLEQLQSMLCTNQEFWPAIKFIEKLLRPLADAILKIEGDEINVRNAFKTVEVAFQRSLAIVEKFPEEHQKQIKQVHSLINF